MASSTLPAALELMRARLKEPQPPGAARSRLVGIRLRADQLARLQFLAQAQQLPPSSLATVLVVWGIEELERQRQEATDGDST